MYRFRSCVNINMMYVAQNGCCRITGIGLLLIIPGRVRASVERKKSRNPCTLSHHFEMHATKGGRESLEGEFSNNVPKVYGRSWRGGRGEFRAVILKHRLPAVLPKTIVKNSARKHPLIAPLPQLSTPFHPHTHPNINLPIT